MSRRRFFNTTGPCNPEDHYIVDVLIDETMVSFLRQLRDGFAGREIGKFPVSIATNGNGDINREFAAGRGRMDLMVEYAGKGYIIEVKIVYYYDTPAAVREEGLVQIQKYRDTIGASTPAYLVIFDRRPKAKELSWDEKISWTVDKESNVTVLGC
jgi:hypothetical protein